MMSEKTQIAVIGAGFSGVVTAVHLLRAGRSVTLINRSGRMARGVAYGTNAAAHVLNVPAGRMSAFPDDEESFLRFARERDANVDGGSFVPRSAYGEYLDHTLTEAEQTAPGGARLERIVGHVADIGLPAGGSRAFVTLTDGRRIDADRVVLALGNFAPADPGVDDRRFYSSERYIRDPWAAGALDSVVPDDSIFLIGTGLTMYDITLELDERGVHQPMYAISRRGLTAQAHRPQGQPPTYEDFPHDLDDRAPTVLTYLHAVRAKIAAHSAAGGDWRDVITSLRPATPALWNALSESERARFVRHLLPFWDVHRHRAAPSAASAAAQLMRDGRLVIAAGRILGFEETPSGVNVSWRPRGRERTVHREFTRVINCTGPATNLTAAGEPLVDKLIERGVLTTDALRLGVRVTPEGALIGADGNASNVIFYVGPLLKAQYWEATAVPELRVHAARLAAHLRDSLESTGNH
ncbi:MAG: FAD/NAD(P)-binding protein [Gemmatimonadota bacterium]|nr:FAD/NAD(P)-binding protein [Gemmatimonadota bacterium]